MIARAPAVDHREFWKIEFAGPFPLRQHQDLYTRKKDRWTQKWKPCTCTTTCPHPGHRLHHSAPFFSSEDDPLVGPSAVSSPRIRSPPVSAYQTDESVAQAVSAP